MALMKQVHMIKLFVYAMWSITAGGLQFLC